MKHENMKQDLGSFLGSLQLALLERFCLFGCFVALLERSSAQHARSLPRVIRVVRGTPGTCYGELSTALANLS